MCFHGEVERTPLQIAKDNVTAGKQDVKYWTDADKVSPGAYTSNLKEAKATLANANKALANA